MKKSQMNAIAARLVKLLVYCVSAVACLVALVDALAIERGAGRSLFTLFFLTMTLVLFGAIMHTVQEGQRDWQQNQEPERRPRKRRFPRRHR